MKNAASPATSFDPSDPIVDPEIVEEDDDWVIVKKRKITILVPAAPPVCFETENQEADCIASKPRRTVKRRSRAMKRHRKALSGRHGKALKGGIIRPAVTYADDAEIDEARSNAEENNHEHAATSVDGAQIDVVRSDTEETQHDHTAPPGNETQTDGSNHFTEKPLLQQQQLANTGLDGNVAACSKSFFGSVEPSKPPIGALNVVNMRLRALNLERKLQRQGGLTTWLESQGLSRFETVMGRETLGKYELANLTMSKLKEMGIAAVGSRRKLIHAIDCLCQPYFNAPLPQ